MLLPAATALEVPENEDGPSPPLGSFVLKLAVSFLGPHASADEKLVGPTRRALKQIMHIDHLRNVG
jgi:hypothetical protein